MTLTDTTLAEIEAAARAATTVAKLMPLDSGHFDEWFKEDARFITLACNNAAAMAREVLALRGKLGRAHEALGWFLNDSRFEVGVGGNPNVVESMIAEAREVYSESANLKGSPDE